MAELGTAAPGRQIACLSKQIVASHPEDLKTLSDELSTPDPQVAIVVPHTVMTVLVDR